LNNALGLALVRCDEQDIDILSGSSNEDLKELQNALSSMVPADTGGFSEPCGLVESRSGEHALSARLLRVGDAEAVVRLGTHAMLAVANALTISRGWHGPGDAKTLLLCDDAELLRLLRDIRTIATHPKRAAQSSAHQR
jgi:hypothetical protein